MTTLQEISGYHNSSSLVLEKDIAKCTMLYFAIHKWPFLQVRAWISLKIYLTLFFSGNSNVSFIIEGELGRCENISPEGIIIFSIFMRK